MSRYILLFLMLLSVKQAYSQNIFNTIVKDSQSKEPLIGVIAGLKGTGNAVVSNEGGEIILANIPSGRQIIQFSYLGYRTLELELDFPLSQGWQFQKNTGRKVKIWMKNKDPENVEGTLVSHTDDAVEILTEKTVKHRKIVAKEATWFPLADIDKIKVQVSFQ